MYKKYLVSLCLLLCVSLKIQADDDVTGFWQTIDKKTDLPSSVIAIYPYQGKYYGRIVATYDKEGNISETIYNPKTRAPGVVGEPYYCGLDIVYDAKPSGDGDRYKGYVIDPRKGKVYHAQIWNRDGDLILRGELFIFGKNVVWPPFPESDFSEKFKKPDLTTFVPVVPEVKD
jgi:uncharacterized protein (DUF2147 family)